MADMPTPPTSMTWQVEAKIATGLAAEEHRRHHHVVEEVAGAEPGVVGDVDVARLHGGNGIQLKKCATAVAMVLTWPGVPVIAWAIMRPLVS